jgi:hypothetical protein
MFNLIKYFKKNPKRRESNVMIVKIWENKKVVGKVIV